MNELIHYSCQVLCPEWEHYLQVGVDIATIVALVHYWQPGVWQQALWGLPGTVSGSCAFASGQGELFLCHNA